MNHGATETPGEVILRENSVHLKGFVSRYRLPEYFARLTGVWRIEASRPYDLVGEAVLEFTDTFGRRFVTERLSGA